MPLGFGFGFGLPRAATLSLAQQVAALFPDVWYDPSDLTTLFQDSAGTTPVTAVEQPVGLMLDKSKGLVLGSELVSNGDFSNGTTGWSAVSGGSITVTGGAATFSSGPAGATTAEQVISTVANRWYQITVDVTSLSGGTQTIIAGTSSGGAQLFSSFSATLGKRTGYFFATGTTTYIGWNCGNASRSAVIDNISVRELPGNHAFHTPGDTTTRPTYSRRINLLTKTEDFSDAAWTAGNASVAANQVLAPDGTNTADALTEGSANSNVSLSQTISVAANTQYVVSAYAKPKSGSRYLTLSVDADGSNWASVTFDLVTGSATQSLQSGYSAPTGSVVPANNGFFRCLMSVSVGATSPTSTRLSLANSGTFASFSRGRQSYQGDGTSGIYIWGASLVPADLAALPYQRVNTATDYDANPALFPAYLRTDGVNDGMQTNSIDFTGTDKMFVSAGVRKLSDAAVSVVAELSASATANNGSFVFYEPDTPGSATVAYSSNGTTGRVSAVSPASYAAPITQVQTGTSSISGDSVILRINGAQVASSTTNQGTGNYGNYPLYLFRRGGTSTPFNGWFYGSVIKGATLTAAQIAIVERYNASKTKTVVLA